ncbi:MAG: alpha/beta hydrolase [Marinilabiliaceae bacterium]|nr:alpha/beta hydrolase [Marinilabiliaceae bacterium]
MIHQKSIISLILTLLILLSSCVSRKPVDYSIFPKGAILTGKMKNGDNLYIVRENPLTMEGFCFIDNNQAVVEKFNFVADTTGKANFIYQNESFSGKVSVNHKLQEIKLKLSKVPVLQIDKQTVKLLFIDQISEIDECFERFKNPIFEKIDVSKNIEYGRDEGFYTSLPMEHLSNDELWEMVKLMVNTHIKTKLLKKEATIPLELDIYHPANDALDKCPIFVYLHGGAFMFGDKENKFQHALTDYLVKRGFIVASINYRLGYSLLGTAATERTIYRNVQDTRAALRFLMFHKNKYRIDDTQIYLAGSSAGGIIALTTAFMDDNEVFSSIGENRWLLRKDLGGLDNVGNNLKTNFKVAGTVSLWGAVTDLQILNNNIPTLLMHGTADDIVPAGKGLPLKKYMGKNVYNVFSEFWKTTSDWNLYGSEPIHNSLKSSKTPVKYIPFHDFGHDLYLDEEGNLSENMDIICNEIGDFLFENVYRQYFNCDLKGKTSVSKKEIPPRYLLSNTENKTVQWQVEGGLIIQQTDNSIDVIWFNSYKNGTITACISNQNGVSIKKEMIVKIDD